MLVGGIAIATEAPAPADDLLSIADARVRHIERQRRLIGMSHGALLRASGLDRGTWQDLRANRRSPKPRTLERLQAALAGAPRKASPAMILAFYRALMALLARETGADPDLMLAQDFSSEKPNNPVWMQAARLRRIAIYITAVELAIDSNAEIGRAIGCTRQNVSQARAQVEDLRESNLVTAALIAKCAARVTGRD